MSHLADRAPAVGAPITAAAVVGTWTLVYAAPAPLPAWRFIPVPEFFDVDGTAPGSAVALRSIVFGVLHFAFRGRVAGWDDAAGALAFRFDRVAVAWGSPDASPFFARDLGRKSDKVYTFFGRHEDFVCARSSSGMVTLLAKE